MFFFRTLFPQDAPMRLLVSEEPPLALVLALHDFFCSPNVSTVAGGRYRRFFQ